MKRLIFVCFSLVCFCGCKKSNETLSPVEADVSGLATYTSLTLVITDITQNNTVVLNVNSLMGNAIYSSAIVYPGDQLNIKTNSDKAPDNNGLGVATINYFYKGKKLGGTTGSLGYPDGYSFTVTVPAQ